MGALPELFGAAVNADGLHIDLLMSSSKGGRGRANPYHDEAGKFTSEDGAASGGGDSKASGSKGKTGKPAGKSAGDKKTAGKSGPRSGGPALRLDRVFSKAELALPENATNDHRTQDALYESAKPALADFDRSMDHGEGVDKALGGKAMRPGSSGEFLDALRKPGPPIVVIAPLKGVEAASNKVNSKYKGDWGRLTDVVRGTVAVDRASDIEKAVKAIRDEFAERGLKLAMRPEDRISRPAPGGYRDAVVKFRSRQGVITEVLVSTKSMILAKQGDGHKMYEAVRQIELAAMTEGRSLTDSEAREVDRLNEAQEKLYGTAWQQSGGDV